MKPLSFLHLGVVGLAVLNMAPAMEVESSWGIFTVAIGSAVVSSVLLGKAGGRAVPSWLVNVGVLAALVFLGWEMFGDHDEPTVHIVDLAHFLALLACCKFFECVTYRDAGLIAVISFLLMAISALVSASPMFAFVILLDLTVGIGWLMHFHARRDEDAVVARMTTLAGAAPAIVTPGTETVRSSALGRAVMTLAVSLTVLAAMIFVFMPRGLYGGIFGRMHGLVPSSVTGLSDVVSLQDGAIFEDPTPVLKVRFSKAGIPITADDFSAYLRGQTFDRYYRGKWRRPPMAMPRTIVQTTLDEPARLIDASNQPLPSQTIAQEIWLDSLGSGVLFAMYPPVALDTTDLSGVKMDRRDLVLEASAMRDAAHYVVYSQPRPTASLVERLQSLSKAPRKSMSEIPARVERFAMSMASSVGDPSDPQQHRAIAQAITDHFSSGEFEYSLRRGITRGGIDPIENFLFENKKGHCEFFASAMTLMCQAVGIPARLVNGYHGGEYNESGEFFRIRQKDAHAWVEVYLLDSGWTTFDPTPAAELSQRSRDDSLLARARRGMDYLHFRWSSWIVSFDQESRTDLATGIKKWLATLSADVDETRSFPELLQTLLYGPDVLSWWQRIMYWAILILAVAMAMAVLRVLWILSGYMREFFVRRRELQARIARRPEARFYDRLIRLLADKGHVKPAYATPREFASRLTAHAPDLGEVAEYTEWFYETQYGGRDLSEARVRRLNDFFNRLRDDAGFGSTR